MGGIICTAGVMTEERALKLAKNLVSVASRYSPELVGKLTATHVEGLKEYICTLFIDAREIFEKRDRPDLAGTEYRYFSVRDLDGREFEQATTWLRIQLCQMHDKRKRFVSADEYAHYIHHIADLWIRERIPLAPIVVNENGEELIGAQEPGYSPQSTDKDTFNIRNLRHRFCTGKLVIHRVTKTHNAVSCDCGLRILAAREIKTIGDFRKEREEALAIEHTDKRRALCVAEPQHS